MKCTYESEGSCQGKYKGFGCIEDKCELYAQRCEHLQGSYCGKYARFFCVGSEDCASFERYAERMNARKPR